MSGFLLTAHFMCDDVPLGLFPDFENAEAAANMFGEGPEAIQLIAKTIASKVMNLDIGTDIISLSIVEFKADGGFPIQSTIIRSF
jgi:hypothetical protein